jgi:hypothetical protein
VKLYDQVKISPLLREIYMNSIIALLSIGGIVISLIGITFFEAANAFIHITSPPKEEAVPAGAPLEISGDSGDTAQSNCKVLVVVDNKQPYQETTPLGPEDQTIIQHGVLPSPLHTQRLRRD